MDRPESFFLAPALFLLLTLPLPGQNQEDFLLQEVLCFREVQGSQAPAVEEPLLLQEPLFLDEAALRILFYPGHERDLNSEIHPGKEHPGRNESEPFGEARELERLPYHYSSRSFRGAMYRIVLPPITVDSGTSPALKLGHVVDFDTVYVNGWFLGRNGGVSLGGADEAFGISRLYRIPANHLYRDRENIISIYTSARPWGQAGTYSRPLLGPYHHFTRQRAVTDTIKYMLTACYAMTGLFFLTLYARRRSLAEHFFFGLFCLAVAVYFFFRIQTSLVFLDNYARAARFELASLWVAIPCFMLFVMQYFKEPVRAIHAGYLAFSAICLVLVPLHPSTLFLTRINFSVIQLSWVLPLAVVMKTLFKNFRSSPAAYLMFVSSLIMVFLTMVDIYISRNHRGSSNMAFITQYALFPYTMAIALATIHNLVRLYDEVERLTVLAHRDSLTGAFARHQGEKLAAALLDQAARTSKPVSFLVLDLDHFKLVNDTYGHAAGDTVLRRIGELLRNTFRKKDLIFRFGGEEFCLLLPDTSCAEAQAIAERLRRTVESLKIPEVDPGLTLSASIGISVYPECGSAQEELFQRADQALYTAKKQGRNMVVCCPTQHP
ncbi:diguanylate cyclase (GGDEF) domain-containing protein [Alkalispirochaeta americana]|uniref:diguanylate cyclase n=1 Tax=Alkalispirochaeta americana TaxID=159291 RepID=A0A1N6QW11_9SPIO|nr:GGDEF domain-containing protein [Alkalispirochaeta americana]SIQ20496.1 diguanylate cyclase (GGDEF) domain-containing protein [Alkalispirochaeta americana]